MHAVDTFRQRAKAALCASTFAVLSSNAEGNMNKLNVKQISRIVITAMALTVASSASAQTVRNVTIFATGTAVGATQPDSIASHRVLLRRSRLVDCRNQMR